MTFPPVSRNARATPARRSCDVLVNVRPHPAVDSGSAPREDGCRLAIDDQNVNPVRPVRAEHDRLLDVAGARRSRNQIDRTRHRMALAADQRERLLHAGDDARRATRRRRGCRAAASSPVGVWAPESSTSVPVSAIAQNAPVMPSRSSPVVGRGSIASPAPAQSRSANSGQHTPWRERCAASAGGELQRVEITRDARRNLAPVADAPTVLSMSVARCMNRATRSSGMRGRGPWACAATYASAFARATASSLAAPDLAERLAHAAENPVARRVVAASVHRRSFR